MHALSEMLSENSVLLLFILISLGMLLGKIQIKGVSLGTAMVLFISIAISALMQHYGSQIYFIHEFGTLGLVLFAFAIGNNSGVNFFASLRSSVIAIVLLLFVYFICAFISKIGGELLALNKAEIGGVFAGALTNTPALEAVGSATNNLSTATVAYSISYLFGVIGMIFFAQIALKRGKYDNDAPAKIISVTARVDRVDVPRVGDLILEFHEKISFSRLKRSYKDRIFKPFFSDHLNPNDLVTIVGEEDSVNKAVQSLGHQSTHSLQEDRKYLDFRRITVSDPRVAGKTVRELHMGHRFEATISRIRRADVDMPANADFVLQLGDRVRVIAPTERMAEIGKYFGDSSRGMTSINPIALGIGITAGILLGNLEIPTRFTGSFSLGSAAGALIVGMIMGKIGRIHSLVTALPHTVCIVLSEIGLLMFFVSAGLNAGSKILGAFSADGNWVKILILGIIITSIHAIAVFLAMIYIAKIGGNKTAGILAGSQTQPAILSYCNEKTNSDPRIALGYAMVYPAAMIAKVLIAKILVMF